jgi:hypothetical protein
MARDDPCNRFTWCSGIAHWFDVYVHFLGVCWTTKVSGNDAGSALVLHMIHWRFGTKNQIFKFLLEILIVIILLHQEIRWIAHMWIECSQKN